MTKTSTIWILGVLAAALNLSGCQSYSGGSDHSMALMHPYKIATNHEVADIATKLARLYDVSILEGEQDIVLIIPNYRLFTSKSSIKLRIASTKLMDDVASFIRAYSSRLVIISGSANNLEYLNQSVAAERAKVIESMLLAREVHGVIGTKELHQDYYQGTDNTLIILTNH